MLYNRVLNNIVHSTVSFKNMYCGEGRFKRVEGRVELRRMKGRAKGKEG